MPLSPLIIAGLVLSAAIDLSLGLIGGGSILTVPVLVYFFDVSPHNAVAVSLVVVGATSLFGSYLHYRRDNVDFSGGMLFGIRLREHKVGFNMRIILILTSIAAVILAGCQTRPTRTTDSPTVVTTIGVSEIRPEQARPAVEAAYSQFIDVRTPEEYAAGHANRARNIPLDTLMANLDKLEKNEPVYLICQTGRRSLEAARMLNEVGFRQTVSIAGGTTAWQAAGLPMVGNPSSHE
jgi:rhodanese-related sulfurtransferase